MGKVVQKLPRVTHKAEWWQALLWSKEIRTVSATEIPRITEKSYPAVDVIFSLILQNPKPKYPKQNKIYIQNSSRWLLSSIIRYLSPRKRWTFSKQKLALASFPDKVEPSGWNLGYPLAKDWREPGNSGTGDRLRRNQMKSPNSTDIEVSGFGSLDIHFVHQRSDDVKGVIPLLFLHRCKFLNFRLLE